MTVAALAPASPTGDQPDRPIDDLVKVLAGPTGDALEAWALRIGQDPTTGAAHPDSPEITLQAVDNRELTRYLVAAARAHGETGWSGPVEAAVRWDRISAVLLAELGHRIEALTDNGGPF